MAAKERKDAQKREPVSKLSSSNRRFFSKIRLRVSGLDNEVHHLRKIVELIKYPTDSEKWFSLGLLLSETERYDCAVNAFDRVLKLDPHHNKVSIAKAVATSRLGKEDEAVNYLNRALNVIEGKKDQHNAIHGLVKYIDDLVIDIEMKKGMIDLDDKFNEDIEVFVPDILNMENFIEELLNYIARDKDEARELHSKLGQLEDRTQIMER